MHAARALRRLGRTSPSVLDDSGSDDDDDNGSIRRGFDGSASTSQRRDVWNMHPVISQQSQSLVPTSPLQLVAQLRGDYNAFTEDVYGESNSQGSLEDFRVRRQRERLQLDSLHARLHGLRLILAMARARLPTACPLLPLCTLNRHTRANARACCWCLPLPARYARPYLRSLSPPPPLRSIQSCKWRPSRRWSASSSSAPRTPTTRRSSS